MNVLSLAMQRGIVGLHEPLDADVANGRLNKSTALHSAAVLEHDQKLVVLENLTNQSLRWGCLSCKYLLSFKGVGHGHLIIKMAYIRGVNDHV